MRAYTAKLRVHEKSLCTKRINNCKQLKQATDCLIPCKTLRPADSSSQVLSPGTSAFAAAASADSAETAYVWLDIFALQQPCSAPLDTSAVKQTMQGCSGGVDVAWGSRVQAARVGSCRVWGCRVGTAGSGFQSRVKAAALAEQWKLQGLLPAAACFTFPHKF